MSTPVASPFGRRLREWRQIRGVSQLALSSSAATTSRHLSFLETGRSRPSREMVLRLCDVLDVPLRGRNELLEAAGLPPAYPDHGLDASELAPHRAGIQRLLDAHDPYPGLVFDLQGTVLLCNGGARRVFCADLVGANLVEWMLTNEAVIVNWGDMAWAALDRLRHQRRDNPLDPALGQLVDVAQRRLVGVPRPEVAEPVVCPRLRIGDRIVSLIGMAARFETPLEVTLDELRVELFFPADADSQAYFDAQDRARTVALGG